MGKARFDEQLDAVLVRAALRLRERIHFANARGRLPEYLRRVGLSERMRYQPGKDPIWKLEEEAAVLLAAKIRQARRGGYLKDYLKSIRMQELLLVDDMRGGEPICADSSEDYIALPSMLKEKANRRSARRTEQTGRTERSEEREQSVSRKKVIHFPKRPALSETEK